jgi:hypothetical protein
VLCLQRSSLVLPAEGAPLVFSTNLAHDMVLHVWSKSGEFMDLAVKADAASAARVGGANCRHRFRLCCCGLDRLVWAHSG